MWLDSGQVIIRQIRHSDRRVVILMVSSLARTRPATGAV
jgi:hypothetical protein